MAHGQPLAHRGARDNGIDRLFGVLGAKAFTATRQEAVMDFVEAQLYVIELHYDNPKVAV